MAKHSSDKMVPQIVFDVDPVKQQINRRVVAVNEIEQEHPFDEYQNRSCKFLEILQVYEYFFSFRTACIHKSQLYSWKNQKKSGEKTFK